MYSKPWTHGTLAENVADAVSKGCSSSEPSAPSTAVQEMASTGAAPGTVPGTAPAAAGGSQAGEAQLRAEIEASSGQLAELSAQLEAVDRHDWGAQQQLAPKIGELKAAVATRSFQLTNKVSFTEQGPEGGAKLGVTSGLTLPTELLPTVPTAVMIDRRAAAAAPPQHRSQRKEPAAGGAGAGAGQPLRGLVDAGGRYAHPPGERMLEDGHEHGFIAAVTAAFKGHYPLALRPQHFWLMVTQGVATHVDLHAEAVRQEWVAHEGKKTLAVHCDEFVLGKANDWASTVSGKPDSFAAQIAANTVPGVAEALAPPFSGTTAVEDIAQKIVVMDICKSYFSYKCMTKCGFPEITLEGSEADWRLLREASERLIGRCTPEFQAEWGVSLLPLLDKLVAARSGEVDATFWNSMCKRGGTSGSGARTWFNGWVNVLFPYIDRRPNSYCVPYSAEAGYVKEGLVYDKRYGRGGSRGVGGPDCEDFPSGMSAAPVSWEYFGEKLPLEFNAGFVGATQDPTTMQIRPAVGWFITHAAPA